jgi:hypothetical protein
MGKLLTRRRFTVDEYHRMGETGILTEDNRLELIRGDISLSRTDRRVSRRHREAPVFTSSLLLVPFVHRLLAPGRRIGILTVDAASLGAEHLAGAGITPEIPIAVAGLEGEKEFARVLLDDELELDVDLAREEHVRVARRLAAAHPDLGAIVLECTNMPPYAGDIRRATGLPVFDIVSLVTLAHGALAAGPRPA